MYDSNASPMSCEEPLAEAEELLSLEEEVYEGSVHPRRLPRVSDPGLDPERDLVFFVGPVRLVRGRFDEGDRALPVIV